VQLRETLHDPKRSSSSCFGMPRSRHPEGQPDLMRMCLNDSPLLQASGPTGHAQDARFVRKHTADPRMSVERSRHCPSACAP
jgi:hypothetical protein